MNRRELRAVGRRRRAASRAGSPHRCRRCDAQPELRHDADPDQHAACLTLILKAIIVWNTRYIQAALDDIRRTRPDLVTDQALARLAPVLHAHINPYGRYRFDLASAPEPGQLRPLNATPASAASDVPTAPIPANRD